MRRRTPLRSGAPLKRRTPLATRSTKRRAFDIQRKRVREEVLARDGGCVMRGHGGCKTYGEALDVDEIVSRGRGGSALDPDNCQTLCRRHHELKHQRVHYASIIGLWGVQAQLLHIHQDLGAGFTPEAAAELRARALRLYNESE